MTKTRIIKECEGCLKEDSINALSGLCVSCENRIKEEEQTEILEFKPKQANENISQLFNPKETQQEKNTKTKKNMSEFLEGLK